MSVVHAPFSRLIISYLLGFLSLVFILAGLVLFSLVQTLQAAQALSEADPIRASNAASHALIILKPLHFISLNQADLAVWKDALESISRLEALSTASEEFMAAATHQTDTPASLFPITDLLSQTNSSVQRATERLPDTWFIRHIVSDRQLQQADTASSQLNLITNILHSLTKGQQTWIVVLQNSDEVRATGGFAGSYALVRLNDGRLDSVTIEDIFDADGQFQGFVAAPSGVAEYTSSGNGLRLPDANWWPDYPMSARAMLQFFALGERNNIQGIVSINSDVIANLLESTGSVWLPDYNMQLSAETLTTALRADRASFFPGSRQKTELINHAFSMLKQRLGELNGDELGSLMSKIPEIISRKSVQAYAIDPELQQHLRQLKLTGEIGLHEPSEQTVSHLFLVESNVGINKSNKAVTRTVKLDWDDASRLLTITIHYVHDGSYQPQTASETSGYVNYQRALISPDFSLRSISIDDQPLASWDEEAITTSLGYELDQYGWLVPVPSGTARTTTLQLLYRGQEQSPSVLIHKQSGIQNTPYSITSGSTSHQFSLVRDVSVQLDSF